MAPAVVGDGETREEVRGIGERRQHSHSTPKAERRERPRLAAHRPPPTTTRQNGPGPARRGSAACGWAGCWRWRAGRRLSTAVECSPLMMMMVMVVMAMDSTHCTHCTACYRSLKPQPPAQPRYGLPPLPPKAAPAAPPVSRRFSCNQLRLTPAEPLLPFCPVPRQPWFARCAAAAVPPSFLPSSAVVTSLPVTPPGSSELLAIGVTLPAHHLTWARHHHQPTDRSTRPACPACPRCIYPLSL
jgi:hypothetical protein